MKKVFSLLVIAMLLVQAVACSTDQVLTDIDLGLQTANVICLSLGDVSADDSQACGALAGMASTGLASIQATYDTYKKSGAQSDLDKLRAAIAALQINLPQELGAAHIVSQRARDRVTAWVKLTASTLNAVLDLLPQLQGQTIQGQANARAQRLVLQKNAKATYALTPEVIETRWSKEVCNGDTKCSQLVKAKNQRRGLWSGFRN
jgi:predicted Fe-S protein YdhL (DUF1289 family)